MVKTSGVKIGLLSLAAVGTISALIAILISASKGGHLQAARAKSDEQRFIECDIKYKGYQQDTKSNGLALIGAIIVASILGLTVPMWSLYSIWFAWRNRAK